MPAGRLVFGTAQIGLAGGGQVPGERHAAAMLEAAYDLGIAGFDTAPAYGTAEQRIGRFLSGHDLHDEISICTKLPSLQSIDTARVEQQVEDAMTASLRRLQTDVIDTYLLHDPQDLARHGRTLVDALEHQRRKGRTLRVGVSVYGPDELAWLEEYPELGVVQHPFNLLDRRLLDDGWPRRLAAAGTRLQVRSVLLQGLLAMPLDALPARVPDARQCLETLAAVLEEFALTPATAAVPFALSLEPDGVVIGADTIAQLRALVASTETSLPDELFDVLDRRLGEVPAALIDPRTWTPG